MSKRPQPDVGIECPKCGCRHFTFVTHSIPTADGTIVRRRACRHCGYIIRTIERAAVDWAKRKGA